MGRNMYEAINVEKLVVGEVVPVGDRGVIGDVPHTVLLTNMLTKVEKLVVGEALPVGDRRVIGDVPQTVLLTNILSDSPK